MAVRCPKCGRETQDDAVICGGCDFILDSSFLGDDIMDAERDHRVKASAKASAKVQSSSSKPSSPKAKGKRRAKPRGTPPGVTDKSRAAPDALESWAADSLILGDLDDDEVASFHASDTGLAQREVTMARMYVGGSIQALLMPDAIPEVAPDVTFESVKLTPFERHVLELVNGKRPVARIKAKARLKDDDFQTALALLADKGFLRLKGRAKKVKKKPPGRAPQIADEDGTLVAEAPSAQDLGLDDNDEAGGFSLSAAPTGPGPDGDGSIHREHTLIQPAPKFGDDDDAKGERVDVDLASVIEKGPLAFADSIISEESVFASAEELVARETETASRPRTTPQKSRAPRRPPLPGDLPREALSAIESDASDERDTAAALSSSWRSTPPPIPPDASHEGAPERSAELSPDVSPDVEEQAVAFEDLETALPSPMSVSAADISLMEVDTVLLVAQERPPPPSPPLVVPPQTDPEALPSAIEVSDFSDPVVKPGGLQAPALPGAAVRPPALPGARPAAKARPVAARAPVAKAVAAPAVPNVKSEEAPSPDSDSGEAPAGEEVSFEMQRKAARIFEQAEKDIAAGNASSAIMNVKLALIYNPTERRYRQFLQDWENMQASAPAKPSRETRMLEDATAAEQRGEYERALELLQKALERAPKSPQLHNRIGVLLATRLKRYKEAAEHVLRAIDLAPGNLAYKNNLGKILAKEESAIHKMPMKHEKKKGGDEERVVVKTIRPKFF